MLSRALYLEYLTKSNVSEPTTKSNLPETVEGYPEACANQEAIKPGSQEHMAVWRIDLEAARMVCICQLPFISISFTLPTGTTVR